MQARVRLRVVEEKSVLRGPAGERFRTAAQRPRGSKGAPLIRLETDVAQPSLAKREKAARCVARRAKPGALSASYGWQAAESELAHSWQEKRSRALEMRSALWCERSEPRRTRAPARCPNRDSRPRNREGSSAENGGRCCAIRSRSGDVAHDAGASWRAAEAFRPSSNCTARRR